MPLPKEYIDEVMHNNPSPNPVTACLTRVQAYQKPSVTNYSSISSKPFLLVHAEPAAAGERVQQHEEADPECAALWRTGGGGCERF